MVPESKADRDTHIDSLEDIGIDADCEVLAGDRRIRGNRDRFELATEHKNHDLVHFLTPNDRAGMAGEYSHNIRC